MRGAIPIVLMVGVTALVGCGGSSDNGASQSELNQARREGAQQEHQKQRLRGIEKQLKKLKKQQERQGKTPGTPPSSGSSTGTSGATTSCGNDLSVGPATSCGFAVNVATDYYSEIGSGSGTVQSYSPTTGQTYAMFCTAGEPHVCTGGNNASVYFP